MRIGVVGNGMIVKRFLEDAAGIAQSEVAAICVREQSNQAGKSVYVLC